MNETVHTDVAGRREWLGLVVLVLPTLVVAMDVTGLLLALPRLSASLGASGVEQLWISDSHGFLVAGLVITMGTVGDRIGRRSLLFAGGAGFAVLSVVAAYSVSPAMLIVARGLLGVAGATLMPSTLALITNMFRDGRQRGKAIAVWATCQFTGGAIGPVLAGLLLRYFWWGSVFLIAVPVMVLLLVVGPFVLPEFRGAGGGRLDLVSVGLSLVSVLLLVYGLKEVTVDGVAPVPVGAMVAGVVVGVGFVRRQLRVPEPLLNLRLLANRPFAAVLVALVFAGIAMAGTGLMVTQYLQSVLGFSPLVAAVLFAPMGLGVAVGTMTAPALVRRMRATTAIAAGLVVSVAGSVCVALVHGGSGLPMAMVGVAVLALGTGPLFALGTGLVVGSVAPERAGSAASMSETGNYLGSSLGLAVLGAIGAAVYRARMAGVPGAAGQTVAGAVNGHYSPGVVELAREAFTSGVTVTGLVAAVIFAGLAVLVTRAQPVPAAEPEPALS